MKKKKFVSIVLSMVLIFALSACGKDKQDSTNQGTNGTKATTSTETTDASSADLNLIKDGTLSVGVEIGYPPFEDFAEDGVTPIGYDIDFASALSEKMGLEVPNEVKTLEKKGVLAPRLLLGTIWEQVAIFLFL